MADVSRDEIIQKMEALNDGSTPQPSAERNFWGGSGDH